MMERGWLSMVVYQALCGWGVCIEHARMRFVAGVVRSCCERLMMSLLDVFRRRSRVVDVPVYGDEGEGLVVKIEGV